MHIVGWDHLLSSQMETIYPNQIAEMPQHKGLKFQSLTVFINVKLKFVDKEHRNNYVFA